MKDSDWQTRRRLLGYARHLQVAGYTADMTRFLLRRRYPRTIDVPEVAAEVAALFRPESAAGKESGKTETINRNF